MFGEVGHHLGVVALGRHPDVGGDGEHAHTVRLDQGAAAAEFGGAERGVGGLPRAGSQFQSSGSGCVSQTDDLLQ